MKHPTNLSVRCLLLVSIVCGLAGCSQVPTIQSLANSRFTVEISGPTGLAFKGSCSHEVDGLGGHGTTRAVDIEGTIGAAETPHAVTVPGLFIACSINNTSQQPMTVNLLKDGVVVDSAESFEHVVFHYQPRPGAFPAPTAAPPVDRTALKGRIVFSSYRGADYNLYTMNADGSDVVPLTTERSLGPAWSPDGRRVAFSSGHDGAYDISVVDADGSRLTRLTTDAVTNAQNDWFQVPAWSPDGRQIAFMSNRNNGMNISVVNADGSGLTQLTTQGGQSPVWSPDGQRIAFTANTGDVEDIFTVRADGSGLARLTTRGGSHPRWSPDGRKVAFRSERDGNREIYLMNADGSHQTRLTTAHSADDEPAWSPDGRRIAFSSSQDNWHGLFVMQADGSNPTPIFTTTDAFLFGDPVWSPDGRHIAFKLDPRGNTEIYVIAVDGTRLSNLTNHAGDDFDYVWIN